MLKSAALSQGDPAKSLGLLVVEKEALQWKIHVARVDYAGDCDGVVRLSLLVTSNEGQLWLRGISFLPW